MRKKLTAVPKVRRKNRNRTYTNTIATPASFHMNWTLLAPLHAFSSIDIALIVNGLPRSIEKRCEAIRRYNVTAAIQSTQPAAAYMATRHMKPNPGPCYFQTLHDRVQEGLFVEMRVRWAMRRLLHRFRLRRIDKTTPDSPMDPITFSPIETPITVYDMTKKHKFVFDAKTLVKHVTHCLFQQERMMPNPKAPFNVITNCPFTYAQLMSITNQVIARGIPTGYLLPYREYGFNIKVWDTYMASALLVAAIKEEIFDHNSFEGREMLVDFMSSRLGELRILVLPEFEDLLSDAIEWFPGHSVVQTLRSLCVRHYEATIFHIKVKPLLLHHLHSFYLKEFRSSDIWKLVHERRLNYR